MKANVKEVLATTGGALVAGVAIKKIQSPITPVALLAVGVGLALKAKSKDLQALGNGIASIGAIGTLGKIADKVDVIKPFTPTINGMGELYEDEDGNIINMEGLNGSQLVQDEYGNTYMVEGLNGDEDIYDDEVYEDDDLVGLDGGDLENLV